MASVKSSRSLPERQVYRKVQLRFLTEEEKREQYRVREEQEQEPLIRRDSEGGNHQRVGRFSFRLLPCCSFCD